jgi:hypothetical protein
MKTLPFLLGLAAMFAVAGVTQIGADHYAAQSAIHLAGMSVAHYAVAGSSLLAMAVVQSTYSERLSPGIAGTFANETNYDVDTCNCETVAGIGFGLAVSQGTADNGAVLGGASAAVFRGVSMKDVTLVNNTVDKYAQDQNMAVATEGDIWVTVGSDVAKGADVTFVASTGVLGSVAADGTHFAIAGARWMTTAANGNLAILRLSGNLPSA